MESNAQVHVCQDCKYCLTKHTVSKCTNPKFRDNSYTETQLVYGKNLLPYCVSIRTSLLCDGFDLKPEKSVSSFISRIFGGD